jgi:hypothetical protein
VVALRMRWEGLTAVSVEQTIKVGADASLMTLGQVQI